MKSIFQFALLVKEYDEAIAFYTEVLEFDLLEDTSLSDSKRWVRVKPKGEDGCSILLARAATDEQRAVVGKQTGGRVFLFMSTDNLDRDYEKLLAAGVEIVRPPSIESFGKVFVFADLYGNLWDLIEHHKTSEA